MPQGNARPFGVGLDAGADFSFRLDLPCGSPDFTVLGKAFGERLHRALGKVERTRGMQIGDYERDEKRREADRREQRTERREGIAPPPQPDSVEERGRIGGDGFMGEVVAQVRREHPSRGIAVDGGMCRRTGEDGDEIGIAADFGEFIIGALGEGEAGGGTGGGGFIGGVGLSGQYC